MVNLSGVPSTTKGTQPILSDGRYDSASICKAFK